MALLFVVISMVGCLGGRPDRSMPNMELQLVMQVDSLEVIFMNHGDDTIRIWEFHNSWGWHTIYLQLKNILSHEEFRLTKRKQMGWTKNGPGFIELFPHEPHTVKFYPPEEGWESEEDVSGLRHLPLTVKAVLEIPETPEAGEFGIFVGKVESAWMRSEPPHSWLFKER